MLQRTFPAGFIWLRGSVGSAAKQFAAQGMESSRLSAVRNQICIRQICDGHHRQRL